ncbi:DUF1659 domain-containing protein [Halobacillus sp. BAB-2008]|uniref:DUF1659 domain-containing protein n=1 Tax=Halobacillus sp. BAB-2008 TaxID=1246484 RepID=UPI0002A51F87|nr:DUF1659 domain-containing protein [Halobacillus sp. BAB-2008]ELK44585.1 hypothetical protein D479_18524 [Halobacillus sp. BAB-2008]
MAVEANKLDTRLQLSFEAGRDPEGNVIVARKSFNNIKLTATDEQLYLVSQALAPLQNRLMFQVERTDQTVLIDV